MKKLLPAFLCFMSLIPSLKANQTTTQNNNFRTLLLVNPEWNNHVDNYYLVGQSIIEQNKTYKDWIVTHLMLVEKALRCRDESQLSSAQKEKRHNLIDKLHGYWQAGIFPVNDYVNFKTPVFIDRIGTHCAVGYLMQQSGEEWLAQKIDASEKFAFLRNIKTPGVKAWADENGFTLDELAWIQPNYMPSTNFTPVGNGTNGPIKLFFLDPYYNRLVIVGAFDTLDNFPCANVGYYQNNQLSCFGNGLQGKVNSVAWLQAGLIAAGALQNVDTTYPVATYTDSAWSYISLPGRDNAIGTAAFTASDQWSMEVAIQNPTTPGYEEIWYDLYSDGWQNQATVNGTVYHIEASQYGRIYVGVFDSVIVHRPGMSDTLILVNNVVFRANYSNDWFGIADQGQVSDTVLTVKQINEVIYFAGTCHSGAHSNVCLTRYLNGTLQPLLTGGGLPDTINSVNDFDIYGSDNFLYGGSFTYIPQGIGTYCRNLATVNLVSDGGSCIGAFDAPINAVINFNNEYYMGGDFTNASTNSNLPHLAKIATATGITSLNPVAGIQLYPNPADVNTEIKMAVDDEYLLQVLNEQGAIVETCKTRQSATLNTQQLASGIYFIRVTAAGSEQNSTTSKLAVLH